MLDRNNTNFNVQLFEYFKNLKPSSEYSFLKYYQNLVRDYVLLESKMASPKPRGLLISHSMGLGKSILGVSIAIDAIKDGRQPILLLTKSLQENMRGAIKKYVKMRTQAEPSFFLGALPAEDLDAWINRNFSFVSMNASNMLKQMHKATEGHTTDELDTILEKKFGEMLKIGSLNNKILIIDEAHNFFRAITNGSKNALGLYDMIMNAKDLKLIFLTGTPIASNPFELVPCFNMLAGSSKPILPEDYRDFTSFFVDTERGQIKNKSRFQNRILGLVSHVSHLSTPGKAFGISDPSTKVEFPDEFPPIIERVNMDPEQYVMYQLARDKESTEGINVRFNPKKPTAYIVTSPAVTIPKSKAASTYRVKSRQLGNFSPPPGLTNATVDTIPVQSLGSAKYRAIAANLDKHRGQTGIVYSQFIGMGGLGTFARYLESLGWKRYQPAPIIGKKTPIMEKFNILNDDISDDEIKTGGNWSENNSALPSVDEILGFTSFTSFNGGNGKKSHRSMYTQYHTQFFDDQTFHDDISRVGIHGDIDWVDDQPEKVSRSRTDHDWVGGYGDISDNVNDYHGGDSTDNNDSIGDRSVDEISPDEDKNDDNDLSISRMLRSRTFAIISGEVDIETRTHIQDLFNSAENMHGGVIDLILISSTGAEGLDLKNGRHVHVMEMYWNWGRLAQIFARLVRNDSHIALPESERNVQPYVYLAIPPEFMKNPDGTYPDTTDVELYNEALISRLTIDSFNEAINEVSIECMVNGDVCRSCNPTNMRLFTDDIDRDILAPDPCTEYKEQKVTAHEITVDGTIYYYIPCKLSIYDYKIYIFDSVVNGYRPLHETDPRFIQVIEIITAKK